MATKRDLQKAAKLLGIENFRDLTKEELFEVIEKEQARLHELSVLASEPIKTNGLKKLNETEIEELIDLESEPKKINALYHELEERRKPPLNFGTQKALQVKNAKPVLMVTSNGLHTYKPGQIIIPRANDLKELNKSQLELQEVEIKEISHWQHARLTKRWVV